MLAQGPFLENASELKKKKISVWVKVRESIQHLLLELCETSHLGLEAGPINWTE